MTGCLNKKQSQDTSENSFVFKIRTWEIVFTLPYSYTYSIKDICQKITVLANGETVKAAFIYSQGNFF